MLATFIIGLREGLEAALIVGIIAAFLRNNGKSLAGMWLGVLVAIVLSIAVGVGLQLAEQALPQAQQEALETVIGLVAVFFVTGMIVWMNNHARNMKQEIEAEAAHALNRSSTLALAVMAFLAVLKEGFETSVFLLATFSVAQSTSLAAVGAVIGLILAAGIGWGIYTGGVRFNLTRFFHYTAAFLILVAAGLVIASLRTAHEAGWIVAGQQPILNLAWLVAPGTIQSALITGVLGIPADPRLIEVIGWLAYLVPVTLYVYWPQSRRPRPRTAVRLKIGIAAATAAIAIAMAIAYPRPHMNLPTQAGLVVGAGPSADTGSARFTAGAGRGPAALDVTLPNADGFTLPLPIDQREQDRHRGVDAYVWTIRSNDVPSDAPTALTLTQILALTGGRIPVGLNPRQHPGPFQASWSVHHATRVWVTHGVLLDAIGRSATTVMLSGGGLSTPRTVTVNSNTPTASAHNWQVAPDHVDRVVNELERVAVARTQRQLWAVHVPIVLAMVALWLVMNLMMSAGRKRAQQRRGPGRGPESNDHPSFEATTGHQVDHSKIKGVPDVVH